MKTNRIIDEIEQGSRVLIAGAGGGFDLFSGLPLYFYLRERGVFAFLASLTFTPLAGCVGKQLTETAICVNADAGGSVGYFPEKYLSAWFRENGYGEVYICCFERAGPKALTRDYEALCDLMEIDTVVLVDGGTDSLMRGDEVGLGTPQEDISSIVAVNQLGLDRKLLLSIGCGVDAYHGVNHFQFLEAVSDLAQKGHYLGMFSLLDDMEEARLFKEAYRYVESRMPARPSIVTASIISALEGKYGDYHATPRTAGSKLWINPLMPVYWGFTVQGVAERCLYYDLVKDAASVWELNLAIEKFRNETKLRGWDDIPV